MKFFMEKGLIDIDRNSFDPKHMFYSEISGFNKTFHVNARKFVHEKI